MSDNEAFKDFVAHSRGADERNQRYADDLRVEPDSLPLSALLSLAAEPVRHPYLGQ